MKLDLLPDFVKPFKKKGYDVRFVRGSYQLFKISSKRVEGRKYPILVQEYIGTIDPVYGLMPKKIAQNLNLVEFGLSNFILKHFRRILSRSLFNNGKNHDLMYLAIIKFIYKHVDERFVKLSYVSKFIKDYEIVINSNYHPKVERLANKIEDLMLQLIPNNTDCDYLIVLLKDIKVDRNNPYPNIEYSNEIKSILDKYGVKYE